jgi:hypothetical protein
LQIKNIGKRKALNRKVRKGSAKNAKKSFSLRPLRSLCELCG